MHARKLPRISEPSFDKDYYDHGGSESGGFKKLKGYRENYRDRRSISPDTRSPRDRERERKYSRMRGGDRDTRDRGDGDRERGDYYVSSKYRSEDDHHRDRSPIKERSKWDHREHQVPSSKREKELSLGNSGPSSSALNSSGGGEPKVKSIGDWSEHLSSSGKKYYYNCISEVSQWEKPQEWLEYERSRNLSSSSSSALPAPSSSQPSSSFSSSSKHCDNRNSLGNSAGSSGGSKHHSIGSNSYSRSLRDNHRDVDSRGYHQLDGDHRGVDHHHQHYRSSQHNKGHQDMEISSRDGTPTSENEDLDRGGPNNGNNGTSLGSHQNSNSSGGGQPLSAALPQMSSHYPSSHLNSNSNNSPLVPSTSGCKGTVVVSTADAIKTIQTALLLTSGTVTTAANNSYLHSVSQSPNHHHHHYHHGSPYSAGAGGATPTHSETTDSANLSNHTVSLSTAMSNHHHHHHHSLVNTTMASSMSSLVSSSPLTALKPQIPQLTPSLARLYKESLITHVVGWPAESVERAAARVNEDHNNISNLGITKVSAELKMARSLVRLAEIQATLREQRILFLRQQSLDLEALKTRPAMMSAVSVQNSGSQSPPVGSNFAATPSVLTGGSSANHH